MTLTLGLKQSTAHQKQKGAQAGSCEQMTPYEKLILLAIVEASSMLASLSPTLPIRGKKRIGSTLPT